MKKIIALFIFLFACDLAYAFDYGQKINSSFSDVSTGGGLPVMVSSAPIQFVAITISSGVLNGLVSLYKSTSPTWTTDIGTWTRVNCHDPKDYSLHDIEFTGGTSTFTYTYLQVSGNCERTIYFRDIPPFSNDAQGRYKIFGRSVTGQ